MRFLSLIAGPRYVELYAGTGKEFIQIAGCASSRVFNFLSHGTESTSGAPDSAHSPNTHIVRMRGLPFSTKPAEIKDFFKAGKISVQVSTGSYSKLTQ